ncbi:hypothetical protein [Opitutus sp. GAS368]|uniref:hypothetical protein n=1 Tax=Opitutus sp. GAS368 TaxID=1882749 RepID=UPI00087A2C95|nr:hypothetical protein [Opitutus sp. GAS368]SDR73044.1 hypothetical protein SAMN05444173_0636 [Opitutus sp. GAS368]
MKKLIPSLLLVLLGGAALACTGCSKEKRAEATAAVKEAAHDTQEAIVDAWGEVKSFTFEKRDDFNAKAKSLSARFDVQVSELRANYSEAQATASRRAAMAELKNSEADYKAKLNALGTATADTWAAAKDNVVLAWDRLQASYRKARAS